MALFSSYYILKTKPSESMQKTYLFPHQIGIMLANDTERYEVQDIRLSHLSMYWQAGGASLKEIGKSAVHH